MSEYWSNDTTNVVTAGTSNVWVQIDKMLAGDPQTKSVKLLAPPSPPETALAWLDRRINEMRVAL
jgi:hypothetical protein